MDEKLFKVWSSTLRKAVFASSLKDLIKRGSEKLNIGSQVLSFLEDGTELDEEKIFQTLPEGTVIYLLTDNDKVWFYFNIYNFMVIHYCKSKIYNYSLNLKS